MAQVGNTEDRLGGEYMIQDRDHMSEIHSDSQGVQRATRQADQSQSRNRQQGSGDQQTSDHQSDQQGGQQGGERQGKSR